MTFENIKIGTVLYEAIIGKAYFNIVERTVDKVRQTEKKVIFSLCPKEGFKDWEYHIYKNKTMFASRQHYPIFVSRRGALEYIKRECSEDLDYCERRIECLRRMRKQADLKLIKELTSIEDIWGEYEALRGTRLSYEDFARYYTSSPIFSVRNNIIIPSDF